MYKIAFPLIFLCTSVWIGCPSKAVSDISKADWQLQSWSMGKLPDSFTITATFADGRLTGKGVCNQYFSDATIVGDKVTISSVGATKMLCPEFSDIEQTYFEYLQKASSFKINKDQLTLVCGEETLVFVKKHL